ncbi:MAG: methionyl-tRNA formyltransferase [Hymenobacteraceae bacterium]|nr:methionyl-tRNA formyltransferase [Hymenobacteraceae bacterium]
MRLIFFGTPHFAVSTLEALLADGHQVVAVVTAPDKPAGRGQILVASPVKRAAEAHGLPVLQPTNLKAPEFQAELRAFAADLQVVVAFRMLPEAVWGMPPLGTLNVHASLLPQYRGAAPINWVLINGETQTGVTTFRLQHAIDTGDILLQEAVAIAPNDDFGSLYETLRERGAALAVRTVRGLATGTVQPQPQSNSPAGQLHAAPKLTKETGRLDFARSAQELVHWVRGLAPIPTAFTTLPDGRLLKIFRAEAVTADGPEMPGALLLDAKAGTLAFKTAHGAVRVLDGQLEGKKRLPVAELIRGLRFA